MKFSALLIVLCFLVLASSRRHVRLRTHARTKICEGECVADSSTCTGPVEEGACEDQGLVCCTTGSGVDNSGEQVTQPSEPETPPETPPEPDAHDPEQVLDMDTFKGNYDLLKPEKCAHADESKENVIPTCLSPTDKDCSNCLVGGWNGQCIADHALFLARNWRRCGITYSQDPGRLLTPCNEKAKKHSQTGDCSSFVTAVISQAGYSCLTKALGYMISTAGYRILIEKLSGTDGYHKQNPQAGDIIMWKSGTTGHIGIVYSVSEGCIRIINEGHGNLGPDGWDKCYSYDYPPPEGMESMQKKGLGGPEGFMGFWTPPTPASPQEAETSQTEAPEPNPADLTQDSLGETIPG